MQLFKLFLYVVVLSRVDSIVSRSQMPDRERFINENNNTGYINEIMMFLRSIGSCYDSYTVLKIQLKPFTVRRMRRVLRHHL